MEAGAECKWRIEERRAGFVRIGGDGLRSAPENRLFPVLRSRKRRRPNFRACQPVRSFLLTSLTAAHKFCIASRLTAVKLPGPICARSKIKARRRRTFCAFPGRGWRPWSKC